MSDNREMIVLNGEQIDELVRCKDCKHGEDTIMSGWYCLITKGEIKPDDFCSRGERKDEVELTTSAEMHPEKHLKLTKTDEVEE